MSDANDLNEKLEYFYIPVSADMQKREKAKGKALRESSWWKQQIGKGICYHCENRFSLDELTMDHLIPISRGGKSDKKNCVVSCKKCNSEKGSMTRAELEMKKLAVKIDQ